MIVFTGKTNTENYCRKNGRYDINAPPVHGVRMFLINRNLFSGQFFDKKPELNLTQVF